MIHRLRNDPVIGNLDFRLGLDEAFGSSFSFCLIGAGPCNSPGVSSPDLCGPIYTIPFLGYLGANLIQGPSICGGSTDFLLAIPATPALVGEQYSSQCLNLCFNAIGLGFLAEQLPQLGAPGHLMSGSARPGSGRGVPASRYQA